MGLRHAVVSHYVGRGRTGIVCLACIAVAAGAGTDTGSPTAAALASPLAAVKRGADSLFSDCARWSDHRPIRGTAGTDILGPSLAVDGAGAAVLIGNRVGPRHQPSPEPELALYPLAGGVIPPPARGFAFLYPRAAFDTGGNLHLVWGGPGEGKDLAPEDWQRTRIERLWHASYHPDGHWSSPTLIYSGSDLRWDGTMGAVRLGGDGAIHVVAAWRRRALHHFRLDERGWHSARLPVEGYAIYPDVVADSLGHWVVAYIAPPGRNDTRSAKYLSVFAVRSEDLGKTWGAPVLVQLSTEGHANHLHLLGSPQGSLHLVWGQNRSRGVFFEAIRSATSRDGGRTWQPGGDLDTPWAAYSATATDERVVHVLGGPMSESRLKHACWNGRWSALGDIPMGDGFALNGTIAFSSPASLYAVWTEVRAKVGNLTDPEFNLADAEYVTMYTVGRTR